MGSVADGFLHANIPSLDAVDSKHLKNPWKDQHGRRTALLLPGFPMSMKDTATEFYRRHPHLAKVPLLSLSLPEEIILSFLNNPPKNQTQNCFTISGSMDVVLQTLQNGRNAITIIFDEHSPSVRRALLAWHEAGDITCCYRTVNGSHGFFRLSPNSAIPRCVAEAAYNDVPPFDRRMPFICDALAKVQFSRVIPAHSILMVVCAPEEFHAVVDALGAPVASGAPAGATRH